MVEQATRRVKIAVLAADAGYDSEAAHTYARQQCRLRTLIPATRGRPTSRRLKGYWRQRMRTHFNQQKYRQRWQVETVNSMIKRNLGSALRATTARRRSRELLLRCIVHNLMVLEGTEP